MSSGADLTHMHGGKGQIWLRAGASKIAIRLSASGQDDVYVIATGARHMAGPTSWDGIQIAVVLLADRSASPRAAIVDPVCGFILFCDEVTVATSPDELQRFA